MTEFQIEAIAAKDAEIARLGAERKRLRRALGTISGRKAKMTWDKQAVVDKARDARSKSVIDLTEIAGEDAGIGQLKAEVRLLQRELGIISNPETTMFCSKQALIDYAREALSTTSGNRLCSGLALVGSVLLTATPAAAQIVARADGSNEPLSWIARLILVLLFVVIFGGIYALVNGVDRARDEAGLPPSEF